MFSGQSPVLEIQEPLWFQVRHDIDYNWSLTPTMVENMLDWSEASLIESMMALLLTIFRICLLKEDFWLYVSLFLRNIWSFDYFCRTEQKLWKHLEVGSCNMQKKCWPLSQKICVYFLALIFSSIWALISLSAQIRKYLFHKVVDVNVSWVPMQGLILGLYKCWMKWCSHTSYDFASYRPIAIFCLHFGGGGGRQWGIVW